MPENMSEKLFSEFDPVLKKAWIDLAKKDLKNEDDFQKWIWKLDEQVIEPFYSSEDLEQIRTKDFYNQEKVETGSNWQYLESIPATNPKEANELALQSLVSGADGIIFDLESNKSSGSEDNLKILLADILPQYCIICFNTKSNPALLLNNYFNLINSKGYNSADLSGAIYYDPIAEWTIDNNDEYLNFQRIKNIIEITSKTAHFAGLTIDGKVFSNSGASAVQQVALMVCVLNDYLEELSKLGISPSTFFRNILFNLPIEKNFFLEIAKARALHLLIYKLAHLHQVKEFKSSEVHIHATTAWWTKTAFEPHHNILRNTTEAMAAIIGGCQTISILPHDISQPVPDKFSRRVSRNISNILKEEAFLNKSNPAEGSYYLEKLTEIIIEKSWKMVQEIESKGGFIKAYKTGYIPELVKKNYNLQIENVIKSKDKIIGVNYFKSKDLSNKIIEKKMGWFEFDRLSAVIES